MNVSGRPPQLHVESLYSTMLGCIVQRFLQNPEQAKRNIRRQLARQITAFELNLDFVVLAEFSAEALHCDGYT